MSEPKETKNEICEIHEDREIRFFCLNKECKKEAKLCILCLKNNHKDCSNLFILKKSEFFKRINISEIDIRLLSNSRQNLKKLIDSAYIRHKEEMKSVLKNTLLKIKSNNQLKKINFSNPTPENITYLKKNKILEKNKLTNKIVAKNFISVNEQNIDFSLKCYKKIFEGICQNFFTKIINNKFSFTITYLKETDFFLDPLLSSQESDEGIIIKRDNENNNSTLNHCAFFNHPLEKAKFQVKILKGITNNYECFLSVGFFHEDHKKELENKTILNLYAQDVYSYMGTTQSNLQGDYIDAKQSVMFDCDFITVKLNTKKNRIRIYNDNKTLSLHNNSIKKGKYYLFVTLKNKSSSCLIKNGF